MKRHGNIYEKIYSMDNLRLAHRNAKRDKSHYREVKMVDSNPEFYLKIIQDMLDSETYQVSAYKVSKINDKGKERLDNLSDYDRLSIFSYLGWLKWCDSWRLREKYIGGLL